MKKFLSIILSILMVVTMLPMAVLPTFAAVTSKNSTLGITLYMDEALCSHNEQQPVDTIYTTTSLGYKEEYRLTYEYSDNDLVIEYYYGVSHRGYSNDGVRTSFTVPDFSCEKTYNQKFTTANGSIVTFRRSAGHAVSSWTNNNNGTHSGTCSFCGAVTVNCTYSDATCVAPKTCIACGATEGDIDATAHSWANLDGICANGCGATCAHENQTGSVCEICGEHICSYNNGFCTECDAYQPATLVTNENYESFYLKADYVGYYEIGNAGQLFWYANYINTVDRTANAVITEDIDLENRPWTPIGSTGENSNNFRGIFDGQNYIIRGLYVEGDRAGLGFFGEVRTGTVKNFTIYGEVVVNTEVDYVGGVIGSICGVNGENDLERNGAIIQNIKSFVNLTVKAHGVGKIGGFVGYANHQSLIEKCSWYGTFDAGEYRVDNGAGGFIGRIQENSSEVTIRNCGAYGTIKTNYAGDYNNTATIYMGGFLSFSNTNAKTTIENCLFAGRFKRGEKLTDQAFLGAFGTLRSVNAIKNCYYLGDDGLEAVHSDSNLKPGSDNVEITKATGEELKKGTVAKKLGEYWEQGVHYPTLKDHAAHWGSETYGYTDNGDGTHDMVCTGCGHVEVYNEAHSGGTATCTEQAKCERCGASYGELNPDNHASDTYTYTDNGDGTHKVTYSCCGAIVAEGPHTLDITTGKCSACGADMTAIATVTDGTNTYYAADAATLNQAVTAILETGSRTFTVELPADTEAEMITAIRRAICDTEGVADGSIHLTLKGVTSIPGTTNWDGVAFGPRNAQWDENNVEIVSHEEVTQLASVNLPDVTEIGAQAFYVCENLVSVSAPKAQTIGENAFAYTALTSVEFPELTAIPGTMLGGTWTLSSAKFPKVTTIEQNGLMIGFGFAPENNPTAFPLELTAEGDITFNGSNHFNIADLNYSGKVDLVLNIDKKDQVTFNDDGTATWQVRDDLSYTFKSITFTCTDGTTNHSYTYTDNGDGTHDATCSACGAVVDNEAHTIENHVCTACGAMEIVVSFDSGDYEWKTGDTLYFCRVSGDNEWEEYAFTATVAGDGTVTWTPDKTLYWDDTGKHKLVVVYPGDTPWVWDRFYVGDDQTTTEKLHEFDLMNAMWSGNPTTDPITLNLKHRLAKVTVNYEIAEGVTVSKAEVYTLTQYLLFDIHTLERKNIAWEEGHDLWINSYHNGNQFTAFVSPDAYAADGNFIKITLDNGTVYEVKMNKAVTFAEGAEYTYKVVITADGAYLTCADECTFEYTDNGDGTHNKVCSECGYVAASENHTLTYSVDGNTITAYCSANCGYSGTATISATGKTYDGNAVEVVVSKTGSLENTDIPVTLTKDGEAFTGAPVNAGTYTASIGIGENENAVVASVEFIIENANPVIAAAPTPNTLTYIGEAQYLISAGEAVGGTMVYSLTENGEYTTSIPQGTNAGDYTVWYYVQGDANRNDSAKASVSVNIAKATVTVTANDTTITYGEAPINTGVTYSGFVNGEDETVLGGELAYTYTYTQNGNVGDYSITPEGLTADNYEITFVDGTLTVEQIDIGDIIDEMKINLEQYSYVYDGTEKKPKVTSITVDGVTLTEGTDYTVRYEDNVNVGEEATAVITFEGNYDGTFRKWFTITKAYYNLTAPTPNTLTYNGEDQYLVSAGTVEGADFEYSLDGVSWSTSIPQAKDVGNYTVYYRVLADENHYGIEGTVDVTIKECTHEWGEGVLTRPVHDTVLGSKDGYYTYTCTVCGEEKTEAVKSADYSAYEAVSEEINALLQSDELTDAAKQAIYSAANECGLPSNDLTESEQNIVDDLVAELEKIVADAEEKIASGEYVKIDGIKEYNKIADALDAELMENYSQEEFAALAEKAGDEINARLGEIIEKAEALTGSVAENKDALAEIESELSALYAEVKNCLDGVHNGFVYEVTVEAKCEVNAIESATCTLCGETDEREIEGTALEHEPNEQMCKGYWCSRCRSFYGEGNPDIHLDGYSSTGKIKDGQCDGCNKQLAFIKSGETYEINSYAHVVEFAPVVDGRYILTVDGPEGTEIDVREVVDGVNKGINCEVISDLVYVVDCTVGKIYRFEASNYYGYNISSMTLECETHKGTVQTCYGYICDACGEYFGEVPGHDIIIDEAVPPTCTQTGLTEGQHCSRCDDMTIIQEKVPATNHKDTLVKVDAKAATCTEAGWEAYEYCTACDYTTYEEIPALKHSFTKYEVAEEAECGKTGKEVAYCDHGCHTTDEREIPALKHSFTKYEVAEEAECGKAGKEVAYCDHGCGATDENEIPALKHEPLAAVVENEVAAECEKAGSYDLVVYCNLCGEELDRDTTTVAATGHADNDGDYKCDYGCGHEFEKPVDPTPDTPNTPDEPTDDTCDHICHSNNALMKFLWKIISFFYRLFNIQQYCDCGVIHYDTPVFG